jgi:septal ring factor EnvC (AmiA/AmiB activator)
VIQLQETVSELKRRVAELRRDKMELERKNQAAVTVIADLNAQLRASRGEEPTSTVTPLPARQQRRRW